MFNKQLLAYMLLQAASKLARTMGDIGLQVIPHADLCKHSPLTDDVGFREAFQRLCQKASGGSVAIAYTNINKIVGFAANGKVYMHPQYSDPVLKQRLQEAL